MDDLSRLPLLLGVSATLFAFGLAMGTFAIVERRFGRSRDGFGMLGFMVGFAGAISFAMAASAIHASWQSVAGYSAGALAIGSIAGFAFSQYGTARQR